MKRFIIFGVSDLLSDIFDLVHADGARVYKLYMNMKERRHDRVIGVRERIAGLGYEVELFDSLDAFRPEEDCAYAIGAVSPHKVALVEKLKTEHDLRFETLVHPSCVLGSHVRVGEGVVINARVTVAPNAFLDDFCVINRNASIGHDTKIGKHALIGPGSNLGGSGQVGDHSTIGMQACVFDKVHIGPWAVVGGGSVVTRDIEPRTVAYGSPAKAVRQNDEVDLETYMSRRDIA